MKRILLLSALLMLTGCVYYPYGDYAYSPGHYYPAYVNTGVNIRFSTLHDGYSHNYGHNHFRYDRGYHGNMHGKGGHHGKGWYGNGWYR